MSLETQFTNAILALSQGTRFRTVQERVNQVTSVQGIQEISEFLASLVITPGSQHQKLRKELERTLALQAVPKQARQLSVYNVPHIPCRGAVVQTQDNQILVFDHLLDNQDRASCCRIDTSEIVEVQLSDLQVILSLQPPQHLSIEPLLRLVQENWCPHDHQAVDHVLISAAYAAAKKSGELCQMWKLQERRRLASMWTNL